MSTLAGTSAGVLLRQPSIIFFLLSRSLSRFSSQIGAVAIGWQVYDMTGRAFDLGMVGLVQFLPTALLVFVAGHAADRFERKRVIQVCQVAEALTALVLAWGSYAGWLTEIHIFIATFVLGTAGAFGNFTTNSVQFGYNFQNSPVRVFGGFDTLKYDTGFGPGSPFAAFDNNSSQTAGFGGYAGVEFKPASNVSLSLGVGYQQSGDANSYVLPGASPFAPRR